MGCSIDILGPVPPPFGGVSTHLVRYGELLHSLGHEARILPYTGAVGGTRTGKVLGTGQRIANVYLARIFAPRPVLHLHYGGLGQFLALAPLLRWTSSRLVATFHSVRICQDIDRADAGRRRLALDLIGRFDLFVVVRGEIGEALRGFGVPPELIITVPAFLPPAPAESGLDRLPPQVAADLLAGVEAGRRQVCCGAYYLGAGYGHEDIYGIEALVGALAALDGEPGSAADVWVFVSNRPDSEALRRLDADLRQQAAPWRRFTLRIHYGLPLVPVLSRASGFLRPSLEDGDSVAVREALSFELPVLASDVVARPAGVATYTPAGAGGLEEPLRRFLERIPPARGEAASVRGLDDFRYAAFVEAVAGPACAKRVA